MDYFFANRTATGMVLDRQSNRHVVSVAASGMGADVWAISVEKGKLDRTTCISWINQLIDVTLEANQGNHGWLYHFTDPNGKPVFDKEVSSIDTGLFWAGVRQAALRLNDPVLTKRVLKHISEIDRKWMLTNNGTLPEKSLFSHGFFWSDDKPVFISSNWDNYNEGVIIYRLLDVEWEPQHVTFDLPLFTYYYPLCFFHEEKMTKRLGEAIHHQLAERGVFGFTACDGPDGYRFMDHNLVSPLAISTCAKFFPEESITALKKLDKPPLTPSIHLKTGWTSTDRIGIDEGAYVLINNPLPPKRP